MNQRADGSFASRSRHRRAAGGVLTIAAVAFVLRTLPQVSPTTVALALLLIVLGIATFGRLWIATVTAVTATLAFNFFFLPPLGTLTIADAQNWIALFAFLRCGRDREQPVGSGSGSVRARPSRAAMKYSTVRSDS